MKTPKKEEHEETEYVVIEKASLKDNILDTVGLVLFLATIYLLACVI